MAKIFNLRGSPSPTPVPGGNFINEEQSIITWKTVESGGGLGEDADSHI